MASRGQPLSEVAANAPWAPYVGAVAHWERVSGRPAPPRRRWTSGGRAQLSDRFSEWLMGLPAGWVTDVPGVTRNEALKALGNGVVPQQAAHALRVMHTWEPGYSATTGEPTGLPGAHD